MIVRKIVTGDFESVLELNHKSVSVLSPMDKSKLMKLIEMSGLSLVVDDGNKIAAFLLAFTHGADYESTTINGLIHNMIRFYTLIE